MTSFECTVPSSRLIKITKTEGDAIDEALREKKKGISLEELQQQLKASRLHHHELALA